MKQSFKAMKKAGISLAFFALISVIFVATTNRLTINKIAENRAMMLLKSLNEIVPVSSYDNDLVASKVILNAKGTGFERDTPVYLATKDNVPETAIFEVTTLNGYSGAITLLVGVDAQKKSIKGVRVVQHKETPGLGDKMETRKSNWVMSFNGKSLLNPGLDMWKVKKDGGDFDQFTGATITPRAIVNAVKSTLIYAQDNIDALFQINEKTQLQNQKDAR